MATCEVTFDPATGDFSLTQDDLAAGQVVVVEEGDHEVVITLTNPDARFSRVLMGGSPSSSLSPVQLFPGNTQTLVWSMDTDRKILTIEVGDGPTNADILGFSLSIDVIVGAEAFNGVTSKYIFLRRDRDVRTDLPVTLRYFHTTGQFEYDFGQLALSSEWVLFLLRQGSIDLTLTSPDPGVGLAFASPDPIWWTDEPASWVTSMFLDPTNTKIKLTFTPQDVEIATSMRFRVRVTQGGETVTVLSPDPVIIETPIDEGG